MKLINLVLILVIILVITGCDYIQQFREAPLGEEEEPFISIIPEEEIETPEEEIKEEILEIIEEEIPEEEIEEIEEEVKEDVEQAETLTKLEVNEGELVKLKLAATDPDGDSLTYTFSEPLNDKGEWQTKQGDAGEYKVNIIVDDGKVSTKQEILIVVKAINQAPILKLEKKITVDEGETITLVPGVSDPDGDQVTVTYSGWMNSASYTTNYNDEGVHTVTVTASDGKAETIQDIKITVNDVNRPPVIESITLE